MTIGDIETFLVVYDSRSLSQASKELFISPQGLAKAIQRMEKELSVVLFKRNNQGIVATSEADLFYRRMRPLLDSYNDTVDEMQNLGLSSVLRVRFTSGILSFLSLDFLTSFNEQYPNVDLLFDESPDSLIKQKLLAHECDLAIMSGPIKDDRISTSIFERIPIVAVVNEANPLASKASLSFSDLEGEKLALISHRSNTYRQFVRRLQASGVKPAIIYESDQLQFNHQRASMNNCIGQSFLSEANSFNYPGTVIVPFDDPSFTWNTYVCWNSDSPLNEAAMAFKNFAYSWLEGMGNELKMKM
ncbi:LysR family transcriptional regulator [Butyrivibrio proteoclasticus]|uniref:LysR family transcriptional regulator n=1 Tax=Butyrivibrio proteoclasticus TaxID=43305 RepID=UPI00047959E2|nr:LysR family transcriptional regulator [Butyrivibrio proteoclasticus]